MAAALLEPTAADIDRALSLWLHNYSHPWLDQAMRVITHGGDTRTLLAVCALVSAFFLLRYQRWRALAAMFLAYGIAQSLSSLFKFYFQRARPELWERIVPHPGGFSFPSGHALISAAVYGTAAFLFAAAFPRYRRAVTVITLIWVFLIGLSRVYLGVHWASDVLAGFAGGAVVAYAVNYWYARSFVSSTPPHSPPR
jgi:undecaprenyl-diphosphatase